ncbi:hypothetical protein LCGC14_1470200 [marine sediment metagenome]|uniref:Uncharacterized protein n=1 Tax=marine sediment metagenome TaxID=412755 RepID=A0A0F9MEE6_9ZZZZ
MSQNTLFQKEQDEKEIVENLCEDCKQKPRIWDINIRDKCEDCNRKHFISEFRKIDLDEKGFRVFGDNYIFYSHTTGKEEVKKTNVLRVFYGFMGTNTFSLCVSLCDDDFVFEHTFGITEEFGNFLIKELQLVKKEMERGEDDSEMEWVNESIQQMERVPLTENPPETETKLVKIEEAEEYRKQLYSRPKKRKSKNQEKLI